jgi:hypothetical protein
VETLLQAFQALHPRRWFTGLWLNPDFRKLWGSLTIVHFGGQITFLALPLTAAIALDASQPSPTRSSAFSPACWSTARASCR